MSRPAPVVTLVRLATALLVGSVTVVGCAPIVGNNPHLATDSGGGNEPAPTSSEPPGPPNVAAPQHDLSWQDCTVKQFGAAGVPAPPGVTLECATYTADLDSISGAEGSIVLGAVRARSSATPSDAGPVVFTTGSDVPSSRQLPVWLTRAGADILKTNPIVAVDRRGMGLSSEIDCRDADQRDQMRDQTQFDGGDDPVANLSKISVSATTACTDIIAPGDSAYDNARAAEDLEKLRSEWDVPALAIAGVGNGAQIALAFAASHPEKVARLMLDSPLPLSISYEAATEQRVKGQQAALAAFITRCQATNCALGPDPLAAINALLDAARDGHGPGGASVAALVNAISTALAYPEGDPAATTDALAKKLAAARSGDDAPLADLIRRAEATQLTDGQFINRCSDALNRPTPDRVRELVVAWPKLYPQFGEVAALDMVKCLSWPSGSAPEDPKKIDVDVLLLGVANDPIVGSDGLPATAATVINAGATSKRVVWQGVGHGASIFSACAMPALLAYLKGGKAPSTDTFCPA